jgi:hypothetical protein
MYQRTIPALRKSDRARTDEYAEVRGDKVQRGNVIGRSANYATNTREDCRKAYN